MSEPVGTERSFGSPFRSSVRLITIFGIQIRLHVSVLLIFALITASLGAGVLPQWHPEWSSARHWGGALIAAVLFFASLLIHELSHSVTAKLRGVSVTSITLFLFGGMAEMEREPPTPKDEFLIAAAGPLASFALAMLFGLTATALIPADMMAGQAGGEFDIARLSLPATIALWLSAVNFMLAMFNMIPGFPLDGGRLFRAALWWRSGDIVSATRQASNVGRLIGWAIMLLGAVRVFYGDLVNGLWLVLIGWFLHRLAEASAAYLMMERALAGFDVRHLMRTRFERVPDSLPLDKFIEDYLLRSSQIIWPVTHEGRDVGFLSAADFPTLAPEHGLRGRLVRDCMHSLAPEQCLSPDIEGRQALRLLSERLSPAPVVDHGRVVGIIHQADILRWLAFH